MDKQTKTGVTGQCSNSQKALFSYGYSYNDWYAYQCFIQSCLIPILSVGLESQMTFISVLYPLDPVVVGSGLHTGNGAASYISRLLGQGTENKQTGLQALHSTTVLL